MGVESGPNQSVERLRVYELKCDICGVVGQYNDADMAGVMAWAHFKEMEAPYILDNPHLPDVIPIDIKITRWES